MPSTMTASEGKGSNMSEYIVGYAHEGENYCGECIGTLLVGGGAADAEKVLDLVAEARGVDRTWDDDTLVEEGFPTLVWASSDVVEDGDYRCNWCGMGLITGEFIPPTPVIRDDYLAAEGKNGTWWALNARGRAVAGPFTDRAGAEGWIATR